MLNLQLKFKISRIHFSFIFIYNIYKFFYTLPFYLIQLPVPFVFLSKRLFVSSWNVGGITPPSDLNFEDLLDTRNELADIYVLGFQEIVPLNAGNIMVTENTSISMQWNSLIRAALNKTAISHQKAEAGENQKVYPLKREGSFTTSATNNSPHDFECIISKQMVGIFITIWARIPLLPYIRHTSVSSVGCGIFGCLGNKGSVSVRFCLQETSFCFVCCHLASGGKEGDKRERNANASQILSRTRFPSDPFHCLPSKILQHDRVIWLGDLNYRIYLPEPTARSLVNDRQWSTLLQNDQLKAELREGCTFEGWNEEEIEFPPTYKYNLDSDDYYGCNDQKGKRGKSRTPAWCDRIIWFGKGLKQRQYNRSECKLSDHRPVRAIFTAEVKVQRQSTEASEKFAKIFDNL
ncbi:type IV inositol polyphosphate 5-phosphatase 9-like isoform X1 [Nicotiana tabacum]|uniref:Type IV inositol polyphosphate 5-phosphatase 9-like isoform X1 n=1 Tax=Nicotiana tabacum TaxID=4097 RepID=A0A1S4AKC5_TOBAC|nr:PREDICTED: type IV inositol polyphosphate 5-phosphatase 9-like isoform X1 [Nicotiana tabacum]